MVSERLHFLAISQAGFWKMGNAVDKLYFTDRKKKKKKQNMDMLSSLLSLRHNSTWRSFGDHRSKLEVFHLDIQTV